MSDIWNKDKKYIEDFHQVYKYIKSYFLSLSLYIYDYKNKRLNPIISGNIIFYAHHFIYITKQKHDDEKKDVYRSVSLLFSILYSSLNTYDLKRMRKNENDMQKSFSFFFKWTCNNNKDWKKSQRKKKTKKKKKNTTISFLLLLLFS